MEKLYKAQNPVVGVTSGYLPKISHGMCVCVYRGVSVCTGLLILKSETVPACLPEDYVQVCTRARVCVHKCVSGAASFRKNFLWSS